MPGNLPRPGRDKNPDKTKQGADRSTTGPWEYVQADRILKGQCILGKHHPKVDEAIDLLVDRTEEWKDHAKANSALRGHFCIVMSNPREDGEQVKIEVLYCTKSTHSLFFREIDVPFPHPSELYKTYKCKRKPLEVEEGSSTFDFQSYVVPYETFDLTHNASDKVKVYRGFKVHANGIDQLFKACKENKKWFAKIKGLTAERRNMSLKKEKAEEEEITKRLTEEQERYEKEYENLQAEGKNLTANQEKQIQSWKALRNGQEGDEPESSASALSQGITTGSWASVAKQSGETGQSNPKDGPSSQEKVRKMGKATLTLKGLDKV